MTEETKPIVFTDQDTLAGFESLVTEDTTVHIAGVYSGALSAIPEDVARAMVKRKSNLLQAKGEKTAAKEQIRSPGEAGKVGQRNDQGEEEVRNVEFRI